MIHDQPQPVLLVQRPRRRAAGAPRRGMVAVMMVLLLVVCIAAAALAINWAHLVTVFRHMQQSADTISLAAAPQLLDEERLCHGLTGDPLNLDPLLDVKQVADAYRQLVNASASSHLELQEDDVRCTAGRIEDSRLRVDDFVFDTSPPYNALKIVTHRDGDGANPVAHLVSGFVGVDPADVTAVSYALLDNQVVGFCPRTNVLAPVAPLAIDKTAFANRFLDNDNDGILEFELVLNSSDPAVTDDATGALVDLGGIALDLSRVQSQLAAGGVAAAELPGGKLGPLGTGPVAMYPNNPGPLALPAEQESPSETTVEALVSRLQAIAASSDPVRVFPVYSAFGAGEAQVVGFVAAQILSASDEAEGGMTEYQRLKVTIEPCYLIHTTAWTDPEAAARNLFVYHLRLAR